MTKDMTSMQENCNQLSRLTHPILCQPLELNYRPRRTASQPKKADTSQAQYRTEPQSQEGAGAD